MKKLFFGLLASAFVLQVYADVQPKVTFVTPSIVRVQWSPSGELIGNGTTVCVYEPQKVKVSEKNSDGKTIFTKKNYDYIK